MNQSTTVNEKMDISIADVIENIKIEIIENENTYEPVLIVKSEMDGRTWEGLYQPNDDTPHPVTELCSNQQGPEQLDSEKLSEYVKLESSNCYLGHSVDVKLDRSLQHELQSADSTQVSGSSADISPVTNNFQSYKTAFELGESNMISNYQNTPLSLKDTHLCDVNTNIKNGGDNLGNQFLHEAQTVSVLQKHFFLRNTDYEILESVSEKVYASTKYKNEMSADITEPVKKQFISYDVEIDDSRPVWVNYGDKWNGSLKVECIDNESSSMFYKSDIRTHTDEKHFSCNVCKYKCDQKIYLTIHMKIHTDKKPFTCDLCNYKSGHKNNFVSHLRTHTGEAPFECEFCHSKFGRKNTLVRHMSTHTREKPFSCHLCTYKCARKSHLVCHMKTHTHTKPFTCYICNYKCNHKSSLVSHIRTHSREKPFTCNICNYKCSRKNYLAIHIKTHNEEKHISCGLCNYKCNQKSYLVWHMKTHTGEKPFTCDICKYKCSRKSYLAIHLKTHSDKKHISCDLCNYKCNQKSYLVHHMRTHTNDKPFSCDICKCQFKYKSNLVSHMNIHTVDEPFLMRPLRK